MPFSLVLVAEWQNEYIKKPRNSKWTYLMMTLDTNENLRGAIAAIPNADLTCRPQILERAHDPEMHDIQKAFERKAGRRRELRNTSCNLHGYPLLRTPDEYLQPGSNTVRKD